MPANGSMRLPVTFRSTKFSEDSSRRKRGHAGIREDGPYRASGTTPCRKTVSQSDGTDFCPAPEPFPINPLWHRRCPINRAETQRATGKATMQATGRAEMGAMGRVAMRTTGRAEMQARGSQQLG